MWCTYIKLHASEMKTLEQNTWIKVISFVKNNLYDHVMTWPPDDQYQSTIFYNEIIHKIYENIIFLFIFL